MELARFDSEINAARDIIVGTSDQPASSPVYSGMGEGPPARERLLAMGMDTGPYFPSQEPVSEEFRQALRNSIESSGFMEWVDWNQSLFD